MSSSGAGAVAGGQDHQGGLVPRARFPEFRNAGDWKPKPFKKLFTIGNGRDYKHLSSGDIPVYGSGGYMLSVNDYIYNGESVCIGRKGTIDNPMFLTGKFWTVDTLFYTHKFTDCLPKFIFSIFQNINWRNHNEAGGVPSLSKTNIEKIEVAVPKIAEQQKIADCLSSIDALIAAEAERLEAFKGHKRGMMQQLFPAPGESTPRLRFPEFQDARDWEEKTLGEICEVAQGFGFPEVMQGKLRGDYPFCKVSDISKAVSGNGGVLNTAVNYVDHADLKILRAKTIPAGATVFAKIGEALRLNRRAIAGVECLIDNNAVALKAKNGAAIDYFVFLLSQTIDMNEHCGGAVPSVNKSTLEAIVVSVPHPVEQQKIASHFASTNEVIATQAIRLAMLKAHKKGLMQQLFPVAGEALG